MGAASSRMGASSSMPSASSMPAEPVVYHVIQRYCHDQDGKEYTVASNGPNYLSAETKPSFNDYIKFTGPPATDRDGITTQNAALKMSIQLEENKVVENKVVGGKKYFQPLGAPVTVFSSPTMPFHRQVNQILLDCRSIRSYHYNQIKGIVSNEGGGRKTKRTRRTKKKSKGKTRRSKA